MQKKGGEKSGEKREGGRFLAAGANKLQSPLHNHAHVFLESKCTAMLSFTQ